MTLVVKRQHSELTKEQLRIALRAMGMSNVNDFARRTGVHQNTIRRWLRSGEDIPLWIDTVLLFYDLHPRLRSIEGRLKLPLEKWERAASEMDQEPEAGDQDD
jgi:transcriptional regulator with XRE-family HTH domain